MSAEGDDVLVAPASLGKDGALVLDVDLGPVKNGDAVVIRACIEADPANHRTDYLPASVPRGTMAATYGFRGLVSGTALVDATSVDVAGLCKTPGAAPFPAVVELEDQSIGANRSANRTIPGLVFRVWGGRAYLSVAVGAWLAHDFDSSKNKFVATFVEQQYRLAYSYTRKTAPVGSAPGGGGGSSGSGVGGSGGSAG